MKIRLPSLDHLHAFEVAARHLSFKKAAEELNVTPAAVGQRIRALEDQLQVPLFKRMTRAIVLTENGQQLAFAVRDGLQTIQSGLGKLESSREDNSITISTTEVFAERWLLPKLPEFNQANPESDVRVIARSSRVDFDKDNVDLAIRFGRGHYNGCQSVRLMEDLYIPVCHPDLYEEIQTLSEREPDNPQTLIYCDWPTEQAAAPTWEQWFKVHGPKIPDTSRKLRFTMESLAIHAALTGQGVALVHQIHVTHELAQGNLVLPFGPERALKPEFHYYLVWPESRDLLPVAKKFQDWLYRKLEA